MSRWPVSPSWLRDVPLAHRGLHRPGVPENSLAAFAAARDAGVGVELDVWLSRDGQAVVAHDADLTRTTGHAGRVAELTVSELAGRRLGGSDEHVSTLAEALAVLGDTPVMIEIKNPTLTTSRLESVVAAAVKDHAGAVCVASFNPRTVSWFRRQAPDVTRVLTIGPPAGVSLQDVARRALTGLQWLPRVAPHALSHDLRGLDAASVQRHRDGGGTVITWTVRTTEDLVRAHDFADNLIFEDLDPIEVTPA